HGGDERRGHSGKNGVAGRMAVPVIYALEAVEVEIDQRRIAAVALDIGARARQLAREPTPVQHGRERIALRAGPELRDALAPERKLGLEPCDLGGKPPRIGSRV